MRLIAPLCAAVALGIAAPAAAAEIAPGEVTFVDGAIATSLTGQPGDPVRGREVLASRSLGNCIACHQNSDMADVPWHGEVGPPLDGTGSRWTEAELRGIVANAKMMFEGTIMPSFYKVEGFIRPGDAYTGKAAKEIGPLLTAQQIEDAVAYLATLKD
jgi:sulfur-oxidizing protein SoxX